jgi:hypothetical protein
MSRLVATGAQKDEVKRANLTAVQGSRAIMMGLAWIINAVLAEHVIRTPVLPSTT